MDLGKKAHKVNVRSNCKIYMDFKDIMREHALQFLPAKSLFRFRGVCRDWKLQISNPFFAHNQSLSFHAISGLFFQSPNDPPSFVSVDPKSYGVPDPCLKFLPDEVDILASSNGLLCCQGRSVDKAYYICNPVTRQWKKLPKPNGYHGPDPAIVLVFEPSLFNFEADYKLICAFPSSDFDNATEFEIYSSSEGSWKISGEICFTGRLLLPRSGIYVDGVVYWQAKHSGMVAFDLRKDRSQLIKGCYGAKGSLGTIDGKLCSVGVVNDNSIIVRVLSNIYSNTMQMNSNSKTWEERYRFNLDTATFGEGALGSSATVSVGDDLILFHAGERIFSYDRKTKQTAVLSNSVGYNARCVAYVNNLVYI